jgi:glycerate kinase
MKIKKMKILIVPDSFKNALKSIDVAKSLKRGITKQAKHCVSIQQLSDGGEGALNVISENPHFEKVNVEVCNPLGVPITSAYAINKTDKVAFIEIAQCVGLELLNNNERNPLYTTTYGIGEMILHAYNKGIRNFTLSLGGSSTNDGGAGMLSALGIDFIGVKNKKITNSELSNIVKINMSNLKINNCKFKILVDVNNSLIGTNGATLTYAPQKGAQKKDIKLLEKNLCLFAKIISTSTNTDFKNIKGSGAAGGIAFGLKSFFNVEIVSGIEELIKFSNLDNKILSADLVISGEGCIDLQSHNGKLLNGIAERCYKHNKPFILVAGKVENFNINYFFNKGCVAVIPIQDKKQSFYQSIARTGEMLEYIGEEITSFIDFL